MPKEPLSKDTPCRLCGKIIKRGEVACWGKSPARHVVCPILNGYSAAIKADPTAYTDLSTEEKRTEYRDRFLNEEILEDNTAMTYETEEETEVITTPQANGGLADTLAEAILPFIEGKLSGKVDTDALKREVYNAVEPLRVDVDAYLGSANKTLAELREQIANQSIRVEVFNRSTEETRTIEGLTHSQFPTLLKFVSSGLNVWLYGAAGGGKTEAARQVAEALGRRFAHISLNVQSQPSLITGYRTATGEYVRTPFREVYENGGVFLIDEISAANGNFLTSLNTALGNGHCAFPDGIVARHADAVFLAADNTSGLGANGQYNTRQKMDAATRERFVFLLWEYDHKLEKAVTLSINPDADSWLAWVVSVRKTVDTLKLSLIASPRASINGARLLLRGLPPCIVADAVLFKGIDSDTRAKVLSNAPLPA